ncbi:MAG: hypothetical protein Q8T13_17675 [Acidobacteriota bacterium]|nr:hypothetical protein [Acidobacteriota bacterium]
MRARAVELGGITAIAAILTLLIAAPVLRAPSDRIFGMELVGRHHDPFTMMQQFTRPLGASPGNQPLTGVTGGLLARAAGGVAAYNWLVLLSFPLAAAAAYLLARHLRLSPPAAAIVACAFAFSPFHFAHAAYHPHIAQVQWIPLYLLALWRCLDTASLGAVTALTAATMAVGLSNYYGGFIAAVITPVAVAAYWTVTRRTAAPAGRRLAITVATLVVIVTAGSIYAWWAIDQVVNDGAVATASRLDLFRYSAKWWSYLVPPAAHPLLGPTVIRFWSSAGVDRGLLEQQLSLGWGLIGLALVAVGWWSARWRGGGALVFVPVLVLLAAAALLCSLSPERTIGGVTMTRPSAWLYEVLPMFRSYARFGVVVQLMTALLAGIGAEQLWRFGGGRGRALCAALLAIAGAEYVVSPAALWRDVLPTSAHRWVMQQPDPLRALDCAPLSASMASVPWLTGDRVVLASASLADCDEPGLAAKLAALGYTHVLEHIEAALEPGTGPATDRTGLRLSASFADSRIYAVTAPRPTLYTGIVTGFWPREHDAWWSWRWMGTEATWVVINTVGLAKAVTLDVELSAFAHDRQLIVALNGVDVQALHIEPARRSHRIGPFIVQPGAHELRFRSAEAPTVADQVIHNGDRRALSVAIGDWRWRVVGDEP